MLTIDILALAIECWLGFGSGMYLSITLTLSAPVAFLSSLAINLNASIMSVDKLDWTVSVAMDVLALSNIILGPWTWVHEYLAN